MLDLLQAFNREGQLLGIVGGHGNLLGQFSSLDGVFIDKNNRMFTSEQYPGRVQQFRYVTDAEADQLKKEKEARGLLKKQRRKSPPRPLLVRSLASQSRRRRAGKEVSSHSTSLFPVALNVPGLVFPRKIAGSAVSLQILTSRPIQKSRRHV